ncbi:MAG TPA: rod shape-determining protein RodA [Candidatus Andersenbacteria bacterium]|nr:rod shape-determining protein RodA [Candidatus Andersenbacteria bacterium]
MIAPRLRAFDWVFFGATLLLICLGVVMLFSTTSDAELFSARLLRQLGALALALLAYLALSLTPYHHLERYAPWLYGAGLLSLLLVSHIGRVIRGATSRLEVFGVQIQPSEFMKVGVVIALAWLFTRPRLRRPVALICSAVVVGAAALLIALEPDFGVSSLLILLWAAMIIFVGISMRTFIALALAGAAGAAGAWRYVLAPYQKERIITFLDPAADPLGAGYNIMQSIVALGSGSILGRGLGHGPQSQLKFLPEQHTDFAVAALGEELGFLGIMLLLALYTILLWRVLRIVSETRDLFGQYLAAGTFLIILISFFTSAGMNMGLLPVTGLPLPLISYGGSNLVGTMLLLALVQSVHVHNHWVRQPPMELSGLL